VPLFLPNFVYPSDDRGEYLDLAGDLCLDGVKAEGGCLYLGEDDHDLAMRVTTPQGTYIGWWPCRNKFRLRPGDSIRATIRVYRHRHDNRIIGLGIISPPKRSIWERLRSCDR
jgi:hypothetical protein